MAKGVILSTSDYNRLLAAAQWVEANKGNLPMQRRTRRPMISSGGGVGSIRRAKTQEAGTSDGLLSVKFVDADKTETGDAFDVKTNWEEETSFDMAEYLPKISSGDYVSIVQIDSEWYLNWNPIEVGEKTTTISSTAGTILGRIVYEFGIHS